MATEVVQKFMDQEDVYGDEVQRKHVMCRKCCVLLSVLNKSQCGIILACGDDFCYVLTVRHPDFVTLREKMIVTFENGVEATIDAGKIRCRSSKHLSIFFFHSGINQHHSKAPAEFGSQDDIQEAVLYTISYFPKSHFSDGANPVRTEAASYFRGGNPGVAGVDDNVEVFYHNCSAGYDVNVGSGVLNGRSQIIGINLEYSSGWFMSMKLDEVNAEIAKILEETDNNVSKQSFTEIREYLEQKGAAGAYKG